MGLFNRKVKEQQPLHPAVHHQLVAQSFHHVRQDVENIYEWIRYLHQQNKAQQDVIHHLSGQVQSHSLHKEMQDQKSVAGMNQLHSRIQEMEVRLSASLAQRQAIQPSYPVLQPPQKSEVQLHSPLASPSVRGGMQASALQERVLKTVQRNSKEYIKGVICQLVEKYARISGMQLREIVVDEQALCSRSSFYRLLSELEVQGSLRVSPQGKEKVFFPSESLSLDQVRVR